MPDLYTGKKVNKNNCFFVTTDSALLIMPICLTEYFEYFWSIFEVFLKYLSIFEYFANFWEYF